MALKPKIRCSLLALLLAVTANIVLAGCQSTPAPTPINKRAADEDISPDQRADKRGTFK